MKADQWRQVFDVTLSVKNFATISMLVLVLINAHQDPDIDSKCPTIQVKRVCTKIRGFFGFPKIV